MKTSASKRPNKLERQRRQRHRSMPYVLQPNNTDNDRLTMQIHTLLLREKHWSKRRYSLSPRISTPEPSSTPVKKKRRLSKRSALPAKDKAVSVAKLFLWYLEKKIQGVVVMDYPEYIPRNANIYCRLPCLPPTSPELNEAECVACLRHFVAVDARCEGHSKLFKLHRDQCNLSVATKKEIENLEKEDSSDDDGETHFGWFNNEMKMEDYYITRNRVSPESSDSSNTTDTTNMPNDTSTTTSNTSTTTSNTSNNTGKTSNTASNSSNTTDTSEMPNDTSATANTNSDTTNNGRTNVRMCVDDGKMNDEAYQALEGGSFQYLCADMMTTLLELPPPDVLAINCNSTKTRGWWLLFFILSSQALCRHLKWRYVKDYNQRLSFMMGFIDNPASHMGTENAVKLDKAGKTGLTGDKYCNKKTQAEINPYSLKGIDKMLGTLEAPSVMSMTSGGGIGIKWEFMLGFEWNRRGYKKLEMDMSLQTLVVGLKNGTATGLFSNILNQKVAVHWPFNAFASNPYVITLGHIDIIGTSLQHSDEPLPRNLMKQCEAVTKEEEEEEEDEEEEVVAASCCPVKAAFAPSVKGLVVLLQFNSCVISARKPKTLSGRCCPCGSNRTSDVPETNCTTSVT